MINSQLCRGRAGHSRHFSARSVRRVPGAGEGQARLSIKAQRGPRGRGPDKLQGDLTAAAGSWLGRTQISNFYLF